MNVSNLLPKNAVGDHPISYLLSVFANVTEDYENPPNEFRRGSHWEIKNDALEGIEDLSHGLSILANEFGCEEINLKDEIGMWFFIKAVSDTIFGLVGIAKAADKAILIGLQQEKEEAEKGGSI